MAVSVTPEATASSTVLLVPADIPPEDALPLDAPPADAAYSTAPVLGDVAPEEVYGFLTTSSTPAGTVRSSVSSVSADSTSVSVSPAAAFSSAVRSSSTLLAIRQSVCTLSGVSQLP